MNETVKIINIRQIMFYMSKNITPIEVVDETSTTGNYVAIFNKNDTKEVWRLWKQQCRDYKETKSLI